MKYLMLFVTLVALAGCDAQAQPKAGETPVPSSTIRCDEFDRPTTRKGEKWTCRILFCDSTGVTEGGPTTLWCDKVEP